jgi:hypothetical protein
MADKPTPEVNTIPVPGPNPSLAKPVAGGTPKTPPDPEKIRALLQMAEMQSMGGAAGRKSPVKPLVIVMVITVLITIGSYIAVVWAAHHS